MLDAINKIINFIFSIGLSIVFITIIWGLVSILKTKKNQKFDKNPNEFMKDSMIKKLNMKR